MAILFSNDELRILDRVQYAQLQAGAAAMASEEVYERVADLERMLQGPNLSWDFRRSLIEEISVYYHERLLRWRLEEVMAA